MPQHLVSLATPLMMASTRTPATCGCFGFSLAQLDILQLLSSHNNITLGRITITGVIYGTLTVQKTRKRHDGAGGNILHLGY
jgi:hypothetical protein